MTEPTFLSDLRALFERATLEHTLTIKDGNGTVDGKPTLEASCPCGWGSLGVFSSIMSRKDRIAYLTERWARHDMSDNVTISAADLLALLAVAEAAEEIHYRVEWVNTRGDRRPDGTWCECGLQAIDCAELLALEVLDALHAVTEEGSHA